MIEPRIYRAAFVPALLAVVLTMFSFQSRPGPLRQGLPADVAALADLRVRIEMPGNAESLNVAAAAAICLYQSARAHRAG